MEAELARLDALDSGATTAADEVVRLADDRRYIEAGRLLERAQQEAGCTSAASVRLAKLLGEGGPLYRLPERHRMSEKARSDLMEDHGDWKFLSKRGKQGVQYRRADDSLSVKLDADIVGVRPSDLLFIWREASLYKNWFPAVSRSDLLSDMHPAELALNLELDNPLCLADSPLHAFFCDDLRDGGCALILVRPLKQSALSNDVLPPVRTGHRVFPAQRVAASLDIMLEPTSADSVHFNFSLSFMLASHVPTYAVNMILAKGMANIVSNLRNTALRMAAGDATSVHVQRMRQPGSASAALWWSVRIDAFIASLEQGNKGKRT
ncbi:hypothetical protein T492DRAFT_1052894, partial [Pavlovales sp. CCMP2436]